jgi:hypothetical protein
VDGDVRRDIGIHGDGDIGQVLRQPAAFRKGYMPPPPPG